MPSSKTWPEGFSRTLAERLAGFRFETLPPEVVERVKLFVLDTLGVIAGAAEAPGIPELNRRLARWEGQGRATSLTGGWRGSPPSAALANGASAHALDFDDQHDPARIHAFCVVLPAVLAAAEERGGLDGWSFVAALATGAEIFSRLGLACYASLGKGWHPTTQLGTLAGAIAAGHALGHGPEKLLHTLGLAYVQASGTRQSFADAALSKRLGPGFAARSAVLAAFLAGDGITGPTRSLEGDAGHFNLYERGEVDLDRLTTGLGKEWETLNLSMKPYPCCRCNHTTIQLALELRGQGVKPADIDRVEVGLGHVNFLAVGTPYDPATATNKVVHAQFSAAYTFARALTDGRVRLEDFVEKAAEEAPVVALAKRVRVIADPSIDPPALAPARLKVRLKDGREIALRREVVKGSPEEPMTAEEAVAKFHACVAFGLGAPRAAAERLAETVFGLDRERDATVIAARFPARAERRKAS
ncbi:MAG: MmgE/PrpD family protein [Proteobacteria bacterium]|nr:MmgE/PrpD family protein [Pseudomonadota bacterium]